MTWGVGVLLLRLWRLREGNRQVSIMPCDRLGMAWILMVITHANSVQGDLPPAMGFIFGSLCSSLLNDGENIAWGMWTQLWVSESRYVPKIYIEPLFPGTCLFSSASFLVFALVVLRYSPDIYIAQVGLKLMIYLSLPNAEIRGMVHHAQLNQSLHFPPASVSCLLGFLPTPAVQWQLLKGSHRWLWVENWLELYLEMGQGLCGGATKALNGLVSQKLSPIL